MQKSSLSRLFCNNKTNEVIDGGDAMKNSPVQVADLDLWLAEIVIQMQIVHDHASRVLL